MKLTLLDGPQTIKNGMLGSGEIYAYDVNGLPAGEHAKIACFDSAWRYLRWNDDWHGNWTGKYDSAEDALLGLREEVLLTTA
jgi:hypothetical protein